MFSVFLAPATDVCHRSFQSGTSAYVAVRKGSIVGNGGVGESPSLLFLVPLTFSGDEEGVSIARWSGARQRACWPISARGSSPFLTIPSSSGPWRQSVSGTRRRSGTCSCMGWPTVSIKRLMWWMLPLGLDELVDLALRVDARLQQRDLRGRRKLTPRYPFFDTGDTVGHSSVDEPMQVVELGSPGRREIVGGRGDYVYTVARLAISWWSAPCKRPGPTVGLRLLSGGVSLNKASSTTLLPVRLQWAAERHEGTALLDSGAEGNLLDISLAPTPSHSLGSPPSQDLCQRP